MAKSMIGGKRLRAFARSGADDTTDQDTDKKKKFKPRPMEQAHAPADASKPDTGEKAPPFGKKPDGSDDADTKPEKKGNPFAKKDGDKDGDDKPKGKPFGGKPKEDEADDDGEEDDDAPGFTSTDDDDDEGDDDGAAGAGDEPDFAAEMETFFEEHKAQVPELGQHLEAIHKAHEGKDQQALGDALDQFFDFIAGHGLKSPAEPHDTDVETDGDMPDEEG